MNNDSDILDLPHISVAPMLDWTDRHCRYYYRLISPHVRLYSEMITTGALIHGDRDRFLSFDESEHPVVLQLGGSDPVDLARCAKMAEDYGYDEVNLNCGCPSDRVQRGAFGACLMEQPDLVAECVAAMMDAVEIPVSVKCRIAIDDYEEKPFLTKFIETVSQTGCNDFVIHARKAWLKGLSPKENRDVPPLNYELVNEIKSAYPGLNIVINGGIKDVNDMKMHLNTLDGVMIGREIYQNTYILAEIEQNIFKNDNILSQNDVAMAMIPYIERMNAIGVPVKSITRHMMGLFKGQPGAQVWRRYLSENAHREGVTASIIEEALQAMASATIAQAA